LKIGIVGGTGRLGLVFAKFFKSKGYEIFISGRSIAKARRIAKQNDLKALTSEKLVKTCDAILFSLPMSTALQVISKLAPLAKPGSLLCDFTSIKEKTISAMLKHSDPRVDVIGLHPLFGPLVPIEGQNIAVIPARGRRFLPWIRRVFGKSNLAFTTVKEHDKMMAIVQCLMHFTSIATAMAMKSMKVDLMKADKFSTPIYRERIKTMKRILSQDSELYAEIEMQNKRSREVMDTFLQASKKLRAIVRKKDERSFSRIYDEMARYVKKSRL
jgi:prephenate dehydrogenase